MYNIIKFLFKFILNKISIRWYINVKRSHFIRYEFTDVTMLSIKS